MSTTNRLGVLACLVAVGIIGPSSASQAEDQQADPAIAAKLAEADYLRARLARLHAEIALANHLRPSTMQELETIKGEVALAQSDLARASDRLDWSTKMFEKGFVPRSSFIADQLGLERAKFALDQAQTKQVVFEKFTKTRNIEKLRSEVAKAKAAEAAKKAAYERLRGKPEE